VNERIDFQDWLEEEMEDEEFRAEYERLGPGFEVAKLRMLRGLTQAELAQRVGTHQSSISRLERGEGEPSLSFLRRVVAALDASVEVRIVTNERDQGARQSARVTAATHVS
jgi:DNA-binding XRE family transcriptional regulator